MSRISTARLGGMRDEVDRLVEAWQRERADLDLRPMEVLSRVTRLGHHLDRARRQAFAEHAHRVLGVRRARRAAPRGRRRTSSPRAGCCKETLVTSGTMTNRVDRLAARGLVERLPDPRDRRGVLVRLTADRPQHRRRRARGAAGAGSASCSPGSTRTTSAGSPACCAPSSCRSRARPDDPAVREIWLRFLSGPDIDSLGLTRTEIVDAVESVVAAHGRGETVFEPRVHLVPDNGGVGHFNVLRGHVSTLGEHGVSGIKVVGDFVPNYEHGLPSELGLATLYDPHTGVPLSIMDATLVTEARTGAMTAVGARHLARPRREGARARRRPRHGVLQRHHARRAVRPRRDPGDQPSRGVPRGVRRASCGPPPTPRCGSSTPSRRRSTTPTSSSRRPGSPSPRRCCAPRR